MNPLSPFSKRAASHRTRRAAATLFALGALSLTVAAQPALPLPAPPMDGASGPQALPPPRADVRPGPEGRRPDPRADMPPPRPPLPEAMPTAPYDAQVTGYLLSPDAQVGGLLLDNGRQVRVPPHLSAQLAEFVKPGQRVRVTGSTEPAGPGAPAWTLTALASGRTLTDTPPPAGTQPPAPPMPTAQGQNALQPMKMSGTVRQVLNGPRGEPDGVVLDNGAQVAIPPHAARAAGALLAVGTKLSVEGYGRKSSYGTVVQATTLARPGEAPVALYAPTPQR